MSKRKHPHYFKDVSKLNELDVYRVLDLFGVTDQAVGHAIKKLLCAGVRGTKDQRKDISEAVDTLERRLEMMSEDAEGQQVMQVGQADSHDPGGGSLYLHTPNVKTDAAWIAYLPGRSKRPFSDFRVEVVREYVPGVWVGPASGIDWSPEATNPVKFWRSIA